MHIIDVIFVLIFCIFWYIYTNYTTYIGIYLSIFTLFFANTLVYVNNYGVHFMIKAELVIFTALCIYSGIIYECLQHSINRILTWLIRLNIGVLIFTIHNYVLQFLLLVSAITTPYVGVRNDKIQLTTFLINPDLWVIFTTLVLTWYYHDNVYFKNNNSIFFVLLALYIPAILHFLNNQYFESRAFLLCLSVIFDAFNHQKSIFDIKFD